MIFESIDKPQLKAFGRSVYEDEYRKVEQMMLNNEWVRVRNFKSRRKDDR